MEGNNIMTAEPIVDGAAATACNQTASTRPGASPDSTGRPGNGGTPRGMRAAEVLCMWSGGFAGAARTRSCIFVTMRRSDLRDMRKGAGLEHEGVKHRYRR